MSQPAQEDLSVIVKRYRAEGLSIQEAVDEWKRQAIEVLRHGEDQILIEAAKPDQTNRYILEVAEQIRDHREAGHYTTQG